LIIQLYIVVTRKVVYCYAVEVIPSYAPLEQPSPKCKSYCEHYRKWY